MLSDSSDLALTIKGSRIVANLFGAAAFQPYVIGNHEPAELPHSNNQWEEFARQRVGVGYHPVGTCRMGVDEAAVVDPQLKVHGMDGLRVIDASIMPNIISGNTNAATIAVAEKAAAMILKL